MELIFYFSRTHESTIDDVEVSHRQKPKDSKSTGKPQASIMPIEVGGAIKERV